MAEKEKNKNEICLSRMFRDEKYYKQAFCGASLGLIGGAFFLGKLIISEYTQSVALSNEDWLGMGAALFLISLFLPLSVTLYFSCQITKILSHSKIL